ncbi:DUF3592 domain-containing protein [Prosthecobacter vanneervenii]|uniref:DUF3592 domain-containing protein n=1 Tax=Prosthecobacter vanneervenii TaxID=48466 RepID=A0A7W7YG54_9BACT|nr:DUF3592 domain-containing protein [Prosthecobacter vanneervenii]MBB5035499.1 hypothetical protein [Prosthecobacter vanneervenii]
MSQNQFASQSGRLWLGAMGVFLIIAGSFFAWRMWLSYEKAQMTRKWVQVPCRIVSSKVVGERPTPHTDPAHRVEIRYEYEFAGSKHRSTRIRQVEAAPTPHLDVAMQRQQEFPPGTERVCYVNPTAPDEAVLQHGSRAALYSIWFPLLFVAGGVGMVRGALRRAV